MKMYNVTKVNAETGKGVHYGNNYENDMKTLTKGYKKDSKSSTIYTRKNSKFFFVVEEV